MRTIRTRFAPSPTGHLHIGGIRTALFSWLYARHNQGEFVLRIEDTDRERSTRAAVDMIIEGMQWLGLDYDEGPVFQTERMERYREVVDGLMAMGKAYPCYCSRDELEKIRAAAMVRGEKPRYDGRCRQLSAPVAGVQPVIRFKNPDQGEVVVNDLIQGRVVFKNTELDDLIIARSDGSPTYNLTVVVDDMDMQITHVMRGDDHLNNTPRQINILQALGSTLPEYAHIPLIMGEDGKKLSKRDGAASVLYYRDKGYLPEALLNYLVRLGWSHGDQEIFTLQEMVRLFDIADVNKSAAAINPDKLLWLNQHYLKLADETRLAGLLAEQLRSQGIDPEAGPPLLDVLLVQRERSKTLEDMASQSRVFYSEFPGFDEAAAAKHLSAQILEPLLWLKSRLLTLGEWTSPAIHDLVKQAADEFEIKLGKIAQPLRVAVTGGTVSPSIDATLALLGRKRVLERLELAIDYIRAHSGA